LAHELRKPGLEIQQQCAVVVRYDGVVVGDYAIDILVERSVIVELKAVRAFEEVHYAQCTNYLKATGLHVCLLINFGRLRLQPRAPASLRPSVCISC